MLTTGQLEPFFPDLSDRRFATELALVHSRFSTNTFPSLAARASVPADRAQRRDQHRPGQPQLDARPREPAGQRRDPRRPRAGCSRSARPARSDSARFDEVLELLHLGGRSLPHAVLMMIPEAWENHAEMDPARRAFYEFHSMFMEPWDGPACVTFTDGTLIGAVLDRNGLRPGRYWVTDDGLVVLASEVGVLDIDPATVVRKGRLQPGRMFLVDTDARPASSRTRRSSATSPASTRTTSGCTPAGSTSSDLPEREHIVHTPASVDPPPADLRLHRGGAAHPAHADGARRRRADRLDGHRHPDRRAVEPAAAALRLLHPAVRAGHEPAAGRDPRGARHLAGDGHRPGAQPARRRRPRTAARWSCTSR